MLEWSRPASRSLASPVGMGRAKPQFLGDLVEIWNLPEDAQGGAIVKIDCLIGLEKFV